MDTPTGTQKMHSWLRRRARSSRCGYTLLEMLLTIGLVVAMAGFAWPALRGPLGNQRLREAAKTVRIELAKTRLRAMETAEPYQLRYLPGTGHFYVGPVAADSVATDDAETEWDFGRAAIDAADDGSNGPSGGYRLELPKGVVFATDEMLDDIELTSTDIANADVDNALGDSATSELVPLDDLRWSAPIRFRPDGTTTSTRILLRNEQNNVVELTLRGLTGVITVTPITPLHGGDAEVPE